MEDLEDRFDDEPTQRRVRTPELPDIPRPPVDNLIMRCTAEQHEEMKRDAIRWGMCRRIGTMENCGDEEFPLLELKNCPRCNSTLALPLTLADACRAR